MTHRERLRQKCIQATSRGLTFLENNILKYFMKNKERVLEMREIYQERGEEIDLVEALQYVLKEDILFLTHDLNHAANPEEAKKNRHEAEGRLYGLEMSLQYVLAEIKAHQKNPDAAVSEQQITLEFKTISRGLGRPEKADDPYDQKRFLSQWALIDYLMEDYSHKILNGLLSRFTDNERRTA